jgi:hypothetical protein
MYSPNHGGLLDEPNIVLRDKLSSIIKEEMDFHWQKNVLRSALQDIGFVWKLLVRVRERNYGSVSESI